MLSIPPSKAVVQKGHYHSADTHVPVVFCSIRACHVHTKRFLAASLPIPNSSCSCATCPEPCMLIKVKEEAVLRKGGVVECLGSQRSPNSNPMPWAGCPHSVQHQVSSPTSSNLTLSSSRDGDVWFRTDKSRWWGLVQHQLYLFQPHHTHGKEHPLYKGHTHR